jgi:hypothetical protein
MSTPDDDTENNNTENPPVPVPAHFIVYLVMVVLSLIMFSLLVTFDRRFPFWKKTITWSPWWINLIQGSSIKGYVKYTPSQVKDELSWQTLEKDFPDCNNKNTDVGPLGLPPCIKDQSMGDSALGGGSHYNCAGASKELPNIGTFTLKTWKGITAQALRNMMKI